MGCSHDCSSCSSECSTKDEKSMIKPLNEKSSVKKVIGVVSGKGGVGKSLVTAMLAVNMANRGYHAAILDADITGPRYPGHLALRAGLRPQRTASFLQELLRELILCQQILYLKTVLTPLYGEVL